MSKPIRWMMGASALAFSLSLATSPVFAQSQPTDAAADDSAPQTVETLPANSTAAQGDQSGGDIVVTGTLIPNRDAFSGMEGLTVITKEDMKASGYASTTDALQSVSITAGASQINNYYGGYVTDGGVGANTVGLRGLGPARTLVLLNGHRLDPSGTQGSVISSDLNVLPTAIVNRIEVLKAGASSIYGSDAVAGVINILTDTNLKGLTLEGQVNVPQVGAGVETTLSGSFGYQGDRLKLIGSIEYKKRNRMALGDVDWTGCPTAGYLSGEGTALGSGDDIDPATGKARCWTLDNGGVTINTLGVPAVSAVGATSGALALFNRLRPNSSVTTGVPGYEGVGYYDRTTFDPAMLKDDLVSPLEKWTGFLQAGYQLDILGNAEAYVEVLGTQRHSSTVGYRQLSLDYPQGSPLLADISAATGVDITNGEFGAPTQTTNGAPIAARAFIGYGPLESSQKVNFVRLSGGLRGNFFFKNWKYDLYFSKAFSDGTYAIQSFLIDRLAKSFDVDEVAPGQFACVSAITGSDANCVAAPVLTPAVIGGNLPQDYRNYIVGNVVGNTKFREFQASFNVNGSLFRLPAGDVSVALGAEYRESSIDDQPGQDSINGNMLNYSSALPTVGSDNVWELFGELYVPLLADVPFAYRLNIDGSARYTNYQSYGSNTTYKVQGEWQPFKGFGFRASYGTSYRAPALAEQFVGATSGFLSSSADPCDNFQNSQNPIIRQNCGTLGLPANDPTAPGNFRQTFGVTVLSVGGAETGLKAETSTNFSGGVVIKPPLPDVFGRLELSADYFDIRVRNGVNQLSASTILNQCYGAASFDPAGKYCRLIDRDPATANLTVTTSYLNLSTDIRRGLEFNLSYVRNIGPGKFSLDAAVTKYLEQSSKLFDGDALIDENGIITTPDWTGSFNASYKINNVSFHYGVDWVAGDREKTYIYGATDSTTGEVDPDALEYYKENYYWMVNDYFLHNASVSFSFDKFDLTAGVRNMFDTKPPMISSGFFSLVGNAPLYSGYDYYGRTLFVNVTAKF